MKICLLNDSFPPVIDGVASTVKNYASVLTELHHDVMVATPWYPDAGYDQYPYQIISYPSLNTTSLTGGYRAGYPFPVKELAGMSAFAPDIIHTHCPISSCYIARSLRDMTNAPIVLTYHTKYDIDIRNTVPGEFLQQESIRALVNNISACNEVWTVSHGAGENLKSLGYHGTYRVMPNGVDFQKGRASAKAVQEAVKEYDLPEDVPVFLFVGRLMNYKGLPLLTDAFQKLPEEMDFRMVLIGRGADEAQLKEKIRAYGFALDEKDSSGKIISHSGKRKKGKFIFTGAVREREVLRAWNTRADLFVFPSVFDTNGLVVREAAACALSSVLIRNSCAAEGITDGKNGFLTDENSDALAVFLIFACTHREELHAAGEKAMDEIYYSWTDAVKNAEKGYLSLLEKKRSGKLEKKEKLFDDPLYEMTAEAALRYEDMIQRELPYMEGMSDNFRQQVRHEIEARIDHVSATLRNLLKD